MFYNFTITIQFRFAFYSFNLYFSVSILQFTVSILLIAVSILHNLQFQVYNLQVQVYNLQFQFYNLHFQFYNFSVTADDNVGLSAIPITVTISLCPNCKNNGNCSGDVVEYKISNYFKVMQCVCDTGYSGVYYIFQFNIVDLKMLLGRCGALFEFLQIPNFCLSNS